MREASPRKPGGVGALPAGEDEVLLTVPEVAALLRTTRKGIYTMMGRGRLPGAVRIGKRLLFRRERLLEWIQACSVAER